MSLNNFNFQKLTPTKSADLKIYREALDFVFKEDELKNIAITGSYSAGKSSVLETYKSQHQEKHFLHISLAHFELITNEKAPQEVTNTKQNQTYIEATLEGKILNQLIHQIDPNKIPQTHFKIKKKISNQKICFLSGLVTLFSMLITYILTFNNWIAFVQDLSNIRLQELLKFTQNKSFVFFSGIICVAIFIYAIYSLIKTQCNRNMFRKVNVQGNEIEIFACDDQSCFDKYLNEVLYLFENAGAHVIVFEDIDRFNNNQIFEKLREINFLINKKSNKTIRFFYLLRDDVFDSKDRTKFFDFIIPIVPVIDSSNSYDQFISHFKKGGIFELLDEDFLQGLSLYIDDMRILKNIYNEFVIYYHRINTTDLDPNKMLAIIAYKNLFPRDFSQLQLNQGMVFSLFDKKASFIEEEIGRLKKYLSEKKGEIEFLKQEHLISKHELDSIYDEKRPKDYYGKKALNRQDQVEYDQRNLAIENKLNKRLGILEEELIHISNEITLVHNKQLREIVTRENIDLIFQITTINEIGIEKNFHEIKGNEYFALLKYLIRNGYIDETYADYMTYFYENSLSRGDKIFLRSITDKKAKEYTYKLKNAKLIVTRIRMVDFEQEEILNFDLLEHLLKVSPVNLLNIIFIQLKSNKNFKFIGAFLDTEKELATFVMNLNLQWPEMLSYAMTEGSLTKKQIRLYSIYTLYFSNDDSIQAVNVEGCLTNYISNSFDYLEIGMPKIDKLIHGFILLNISFVSIDFDNANKALFDEVYQKSLYDINFENISLILQKVYLLKDESSFYSKNYSLVLKQPKSPLAKFVKKNMSKYIDCVLANSKGVINDDENVALLILNDSAVTMKQKNDYISLLQTSIISIVDVDKELWSSLLENHLVIYSVDNIIEYYEEKKALEYNIITLINSEESKLDFSQVMNKFGKDRAEKFFDATIVCKELYNRKYREIITSLGFYYDTFNVEGLETEKLRIIIDESIVLMNSETLLFIREKYSDQVLYYIKKNITQYSEINTKEIFNFDEVIEILSWGDVTDDIKIKLLELTNEHVSILNKGYSIFVNVHILKNNLDPNDLHTLFATYVGWENSIQQVIYSLAIREIASISINPKVVSDELLRMLLVSNELNENQKVDLFIALLPNLGESLCKEYINLLGLVEYKKLFESRSRPRFVVNDTNWKLLTAFKDRGWIHEFQEEQEKTGYYKIMRQKSTIKSLSAEML